MGNASPITYVIVRFEVFPAVVMKNVIFWDVPSCDSCRNRHSSETSVPARTTQRHIQEDDILQCLLIFKAVKKRIELHLFHISVSKSPSHIYMQCGDGENSTLCPKPTSLLCYDGLSESFV